MLIFWRDWLGDIECRVVRDIHSLLLGWSTSPPTMLCHWSMRERQPSMQCPWSTIPPSMLCLWSRSPPSMLCHTHSFPILSLYFHEQISSLLSHHKKTKNKNTFASKGFRCCCCLVLFVCLTRIEAKAESGSGTGQGKHVACRHPRPWNQAAEAQNPDGPLQPNFHTENATRHRSHSSALLWQFTRGWEAAQCTHKQIRSY